MKKAYVEKCGLEKIYHGQSYTRIHGPLDLQKKKKKQKVKNC